MTAPNTPSVRRLEWRNGATDDLPDGPWKSEPDKVQWIDPATDLDCLIVRGPLGALCGYVGVPPGHPAHGLGYDEAWERFNLDAHGGLTFAAGCEESDLGDAHGICHVPAPGRAADLWWLGFDCVHSGDLAPSMMRPASGFLTAYHEVYRDIDYVTAECSQLAQHLAVAVP
jgi:hypothetical protein